ncbi:hypothetical protein ABPG74_015556 [Tetrahymena malaccensis]
MNLKGVGLINYLYIIVLTLGTWINVNIFSSILWFGILLYIYNVFCVDDRGARYFKNLRFLIVFLMSFTSLILIFHSYILYEYLSSNDQDTYYQEVSNIGFEYGKNTNILQETIINIVLSFLSFILSIMVFIQINKQEDIFLGKGEDLRSSNRKTVNNQNTFQTLVAKYEWSQTLITISIVILIVATVLIDGIFGVIYSIILTSWLLTKLKNKGNELQLQIDIDKQFLTFLKYFSLLTCYCCILWKLNVFVRKYKGLVYIINGYVTSYTVLFITSFIMELLLFMLSVYAYDLLSQINSQHISAIKLKQEKSKPNSSIIKVFLTSNYFGIVTGLCFIWSNIIPSLLMFIPLLTLLIGSVNRKHKDAKLKTAIIINYFSYIFLVVIIIFNIPFVFKYVTGSLLFDLLGLHSYNEEQNGVDGFLDRMAYLSLYLITVGSIYYITLLKIYEKEIQRDQYHSLAQQQGLHHSINLSHHSQQHSISLNQPSELTLPPHRQEDDDNNNMDQGQHQDQINQQSRHQESDMLKSSILRQGESVNESQLSQQNDNLKKQKKKTKSKFKLAMQDFWKELKRTSLLHLEKLNVFLIFAVSIYKIDVIHSIYMIAFISLVFSHMKHWRNILRAVIAYSYAVIILHYIFTVLYEAKAIKQISQAWQLIGINEKPTAQTFLTVQTFEIVIILIFTYCQANIVYVTDTYNHYRQQSIELEEESTTLQRKQQIIKQMDFFSRFFIYYGVWVCYINLLSVGLIPPANILSLGYLIFLQLFISFTMYENHERRALSKIMKGWPLLVFISSFILIVRYLSLFSILNGILQSILPSKKVIEDIGLSNEMNTLQICGNAFILFILNAQKRLIDAKIYEEGQSDIEQQDKQSNDFEVDLKNHRYFTYQIYILKIKCLVLLSTHFSKFVLFYGLLLSILHSSFAGVVACFLQMLIFLWGRDTYWQRVWIPLWLLSFVFLLSQYLFQLHIIGDHLSDAEKSWAGVFSISSSRYWVFLILYIVQQILCVFMRKLQKFEERLSNSSYQKFIHDYQTVKQSYQIEKKRIDEENDQELMELLDMEEKEKYQQELQLKIQQQSLSLSNKKRKKDINSDSLNSPQTKLSRSLLKKHKQSGDEQSDQQITQNKICYQTYLKWNPYKKGVDLEYELKEFFKYFGYEISIFVLIVAAYFEMNAVSLIHIILAVFFALFSNVINSQSMYSPKTLLFVNYVWRFINYLMVLDITRKYIISIWFPQDWKVSKPWNSWDFTCSKQGKKSYSSYLNHGIQNQSDKISDYDSCTHDWRYWLSLEEESNLHLILDVINFQIMVIYDRYFREIYQQNGPKRCHSDIKSQDQLDFTRKNDFFSYLKLFIFGYFYQIPIMIYFIIGCLSNISSYTDIISIVYVFTSIFMLFKTKMLLREKNNIWKYLLMFNTLVMVILCLYQSPFFQCPIIYPDNRYYLNSEECLYLQNSKKGQLYILEVLNREVDSIDDLYILLSHIFGFNKSHHFHFGFTKEVFMIIFVLFGLLQKNLWNHPYTEYYIEPYFKEEKEKQKENAINIIEALHVARISSNIQQEMELEVYDSIQSRVENKVVIWEKMVSSGDQSSNPKLQTEEGQHLLEQDINKEEKQVSLTEEQQEEEGQQKLSEKDQEIIMHKAEKIVLESNIPIHLKDVIKICTQYKKDEEKLEIEIENLKTSNLQMIIEMVYDNQNIGINQFKDQMITLHQIRVKQAALNFFEIILKYSLQKLMNLYQILLSKKRKQIENMALDKKDKDLSKQEGEKEKDANQQQVQDSQDHPSQEIQQEKNMIQELDQVESVCPSNMGEDAQKLKEQEMKQQQKSFKIIILKIKDLFKAIKVVLINMMCSMLSELSKDTINLYKKQNSLSLIFIVFMQRKFQLICGFAFQLNAINNADIVSVIYPVVYLTYCLVESPFPTRTFWKLIMYYTILIITLKFLYQLPVFCGTPPYTFFLFSDGQDCSTSNITSEQARTRIDFIIGIKKYTGPASYPRDQGFFSGIFWDYIILLCLFIQRYLLQLEGRWTYVFISKDECYIPQFRDPLSEYSKYHKLPMDQQMKRSFSLDGITDATINYSEYEDQQQDDFIQDQVLSHQDLNQYQAADLNQHDINHSNESEENQDLIQGQRDQVINRNILQDLNQSQEEEKDQVASLHQQQSNNSDDDELNKMINEVQDEEDNQYYRRINFFMLFIYRLFPQYLQNFYKKKIKNEISLNKQKQQLLLTEEEKKAAQILHEAKIESLEMKDEDIQGTKPGRNFYIHQFVSSFFVLIYFILFYNKMASQSTRDITNETRFSRSVVIIILICITVMVMDRILYKLRRIKSYFVDMHESAEQVEERKQDSTQHAAIIKLVIHILITICSHIYLFFILPDQTYSRFYENSYLIACYMLIIVYLYFSALQIKFGYPQMSVGSIFSRDTSLVYRLSFIVYRALPFLYELRSVIDWTFTSTSLDLFQWFKLEDAYANLYSVKAEMNVRKETHKFGQKRDFVEKCTNGFLFLIFLLVIILLPIFLFSNLNPAVELNNLTSGQVKLEFQVLLTGKEYHVRIYQKNGIEVKDFTDQQFNTFDDLFYAVDDLWQDRLQVVKMDKFSDKYQEFNENMVKDFEKYFNNPDLKMGVNIEFTFNRPKPEGKEQVKAKQVLNFDKDQMTKMKKILTDMRIDMQSEKKTKYKQYKITLYEFVPFFYQIPDGQNAVDRAFEPQNKDELDKYNKSLPEEMLQDPNFDPNVLKYLDAELLFIMEEGEYQWQIQRKSSPYFDKIVPNVDDRIAFITLSEKTFSSILRSMSDNLSVVGIYLTVVLTVGRFLRIYFNNVSMRCIWEEMPDTNDLFDLCQSIYIARLEQNLMKEERNYELLIRILRSPEILMRLTGKSLYDI